MIDTKQRILDAAEKLFGEKGYDSTSLRQIISEAKVNLAAIHYHFGSKQELLDQVIIRKAGPMNERRLKLLDRFEAESAPESAALEKIVVAFVLPAILVEKSPGFVKLMGRVHAEGLMPEIARRNFQPMIARFLSALHRALPDSSQKELIWKAHFALGAMSIALTASPDVDPETAAESPTNLANRLVAFISSGFRAPATLD
ncbi:MAG: TetR family transcriptional regulator [Acidobacteria bacterium]|nr:TetR family transcriptional regulator [Acidobacteriota bacterium]